MAEIKKIEIKIPPVFKLKIESESVVREGTFKTWNDAFQEGKKTGLAFTVLMKGFSIASWSLAQGFYSYVAPELILQQENFNKRIKTPRAQRGATH